MIRNTLALIVALAAPWTADAGTLFSYDFNGPDPWPAAATDVMPATPIPVEPSAEVKPVGTIDVAGSTEASGGLAFSIEVGDVKTPWEALLVSGLLGVKNAEADLARLTLSFDLASSVCRPVTVRIESYDAQKKRTGGLETIVYPAAAEFMQRYALDLSTMKPAGAGKFVATDPNVQLTYVVAGPAWPSGVTHAVRLDNVHYASPAMYVSPEGSDDNDGRTEAKSLLTPQKAIDLAKPGDIILLMEGTYERPKSNTEQNGIIHFEGAGTPAAWISIRNYPGHKPMLFNTDSWDTIRVGGPRRDASAPETAVAYFEVRGLHMRGNADKVKVQHADLIGQAKAVTNANGISISPRGRTLIPHHIRIADNRIELMPGGGASGLGGDWITIENNEVHNNCWFMIYGGSGISLLDQQNFDGIDNLYKCLIRNNRVSWNRCYVPWVQVKKMSDGNGIIVDTNYPPDRTKAYNGRTLVQNSVSVANGGSAIHTFKSHRIDIVNNTAYLSAATPELSWGQIFVQRANDVNVVNNVMVARDGQPVNTVNKDSSDKGNTNVKRSNNVYFGGGFGPIMGTDDLVADPQLMKPSVVFSEGDFRLKPTSPAIGRGK